MKRGDFIENKKSTVFYAFGCDAEHKYKFNTGKWGAGALRWLCIDIEYKSSKEYYSGDSNLDGKTDIRDAISAQKIGFTYGSFASYTTDMNNDQKITKADAAAILKNIAA